MDAARVRVHQLRQRVDVGGLDLADLAELEDVAHDGMHVSQPFQDLGVGGVAGLGAFGPFEPGQLVELELLEQERAELLR